jgi:hypothetical protein
MLQHEVNEDGKKYLNADVCLIVSAKRSTKQQYSWPPKEERESIDFFAGHELQVGAAATDVVMHIQVTRQVEGRTRLKGRRSRIMPTQ